MATVAHKVKSALQAQMHDVAVRSHADRSGKYPREVKRAATGDLGQRTSLNALIQMGNDVVPETAQHLLLQPAERQAFEFCSMSNKQTVNEAAGHTVPEQRPVGIAVGALHRQAARKIEQRLIAAREALDQLCFKCRALGGCKRKPGWINRHYNGFQASFTVGCVVGSGGTDRKGPRRPSGLS